MTGRDVTTPPDVARPPQEPEQGSSTGSSAEDERIQRFARAELGPASACFLQEAAHRQPVLERMRAGRSIEDAVLPEVHAGLSTHRQLADEFAGYFLFDLMKAGRFSMKSTSRLRRFLDTGDLVLSVFGDLWGDLSKVSFESPDQFKRLFAQRVEWKAADKARGMDAGTRREDRREGAELDELDGKERSQAPLPTAIQEEERQRLILILLRLKDRDRKLLTHYLKGNSLATIADELGLTRSAARRALSRAIQQARDLVTASEECRQARC